MAPYTVRPAAATVPQCMPRRRTRGVLFVGLCLLLLMCVVGPLLTWSYALRVTEADRQLAMQAFYDPDAVALTQVRGTEILEELRAFRERTGHFPADLATMYSDGAPLCLAGGRWVYGFDDNGVAFIGFTYNGMEYPLWFATTADVTLWQLDD